MKKIFKRVSAAVMTLAVMLAAVVFDVPGRLIAAATCPGHSGLTKWTSKTGLPFSGSYYLDCDVTVDYPHQINGDLTLCLNGHTITGSKGIYSVEAENKKAYTLTLYDCKETGKLTGATTSTNQSAPISVAGGTFNMYGGNITGNSITSVYIRSNYFSGCDSVFNMHGGSISNNTDNGVEFSGARFNMDGGTISNNKAEDGGGVAISSGTFTMSGGTISNNNATGNGGGVLVYGSGKFVMSGGAITGNTAGKSGGGIRHSGNSVTLSGKVNISGNKSGGSDDNICLNDEKTLTIESGFATDSPIGVSVQSAPSCDSPVAITGDVDGALLAKFKCEQGSGYELEHASNVIRIKKPHTYGDEWATSDQAHWHTCTGCGMADTKTSHTWDSGKVTTAATCTAKGVRTYTCSVCKTTKTEEIAALGHSWSTSWTTDSNNHWHTCTRSGCTSVNNKTAHSGGTATCQEKATCSVCKQKYGSLGAHNHSTAWTTSSTQHWHACLTSGCTDKSYTADHTFVQEKDGTNHWQECSVCGYKKDVTAHTWGSWELTKEPTLKTTGEAERECNCGEKDTKSDVPALNDTAVWTKGSRTDPTLNGPGSEDYTSTDYGTVTIAIPALTDETVWTKVEDECAAPTEEQNGRDVYTSDDYGKVTVILPALDHTHVWGDWEITKAPSLNKTGTAKRVCTKDDTHYETKELPILSDITVWTKGDHHTDPTLKDEGSQEYTSEYGTVTLPIPELTDEVWTKVDRTDPTLDGTGSEEYTSDDYGNVTITIPDLKDPIWTKGDRTDPTLDSEGSQKYISEDYGDVTITVPDLKDPIWTKGTRTDPTLEEKGSQEYTSEDYGEVTIDIPALTDPIWTKDSARHEDPTEEADGRDVYTSADYGEVPVILPALGHTHEWGNWTITTAPTLTETGIAQRVCVKNNTHTDTKTLPALTDTSVWTKNDDKHVDPTEDSDGRDVYTSEYGEVPVPLDKLPHTHRLTYVPEVPATETTEGVKEHWHCDGCGKDFTDENGTNEITDLTIPVIGHEHTLVHVPEVPATETTEGVKEHWHCEVCGKDFEDENGTKELTGDTIKIGKLEVEIQAPANVPQPEIATSREELIAAALTAEEQKKVEEGTDIKIILKIEDASDSAPAGDKEKIDTAIGGLEDHVLGLYLDITLLKRIGEQEEKITRTNDLITITFEVPSELRGKAEYTIVRVHDGEITVLSDKDSDPDTITIETDRFSTYALTYREKAAPAPGTGGSGGSSSGSGSGRRPHYSNSAPTESVSSDDTSDSNDTPPTKDSSDITAESEPTEEVPETVSGGEIEIPSSEDSYTAPSDESAPVPVDESAPAPSADSTTSSSEEPVPSDDTGDREVNPSTGAAVSLIPLAAVAVIIAAAKRKKK